MTRQQWTTLTLLLTLLVACGNSETKLSALASSNLIQNGDFGDGQANWAISADTSKGVTFGKTIDEYGRYCVWVGQGGSEPWDVYLYQNGLTLEPGHTYTLEFTAVTSIGKSAEFSTKVGGDTGPYTPYSVSTHQVSGGDAQRKRVTFEVDGAKQAQLELQVGGGNERYFCFDDVSLTASSPEPVEADPNPDPVEVPVEVPEEAPASGAALRDLASDRGVKIGAALQSTPLAEEAAYAETAGREFNLLSPEGSFLISEMHDPSDPFRLANDLSDLDAQVNFAREEGAAVTAFHLVWFLEGTWAPWLHDIPADQRQTFIDTRIEDVMTRYKGKVKTYSVVNEAFEKDGSLRGATVQHNGQDVPNWLAPVDNYIEKSFRKARQIDPGATLIYNDYGLEYGGPKWDAVLAMVKDFEARGVPIDGVGFQGHFNMKWGPLPDPAELAKHMRQLEELGLEAQITEFDVGIEGGEGSEAERLEVQAQYYKDYMQVCLDAPNCNVFSMWGFTDKHSWITESLWGGSPAAKPLIYDTNYRPKASYYSLREALR